MASRVSRIYGDAYISLAEEESRREDAMKEAAALLQILDENEEFVQLLHHPEISKDEKMRITEQILKGRVSDDMTGFVMIILDKGRSQEMHDIFAYILEQMKKLQGIGSLKVTSAKALSQEDKDKIEAKVLQITSYKELETVYEIDEGIIGGLILCMDERIVDNSIRTKLETMGKHLSQIQLS